MKVGMTSLTLRDESVSSVVRVAKKARLDGIEWGVSEKHMQLCNAERAKEIKELSAEYGISIFSLGSYCYMETKEECDNAIETAVMLEAPIIRIWGGKKPPCDCDNIYKEQIVNNTIYMAQQASKHNVVLGFEYHPWTLTETCEDALSLVKSVSKDNVGLYWQPQCSLSPEANLRDRNKVLRYCVGNMHIQNYVPEYGYDKLSSIEDNLRLYFGDIQKEEYRVMIEFVKDGSVENLIDDICVLKKVLYI